ncbi:MAG: 3-isopropylmalate dehydratase large subunit [Variovorax sp.]|nr:3-isopropylmalate dehydratase large subunit [Variovorax sp.]
MNARTLFDKLWDAHVVRDLGDGWALLHIDRHLLHDLSGPPALGEVAARGLPLHNPELVFATPDHAVSSQPGRVATTFPLGGRLHGALKQLGQKMHVRLFDLGEPGQGIVHVMGPELGIVLPGLTVICGDSHTCTNGGLGAMAFGVGSSESTHALATQTLRQQKPRQMRVRVESRLRAGVSAKDLALHIIGRLGAAAGVAHAIEFAGPAIEAMDVEGRLTLCNLSVELGARFGLVAPDERTFAYLRGRSFAPQGDDFDAAVTQWRELPSDEGALFDREEVIDASSVRPTITWGTSPEHAIPIDGYLPDPQTASNDTQRDNIRAALDYMGLAPGQKIAGTPVDWVFIGSCANARLSDLRAAAEIARGRKVAPGVNAWVVPGSENVKREAEAEGLREVFEAAGFSWREPGCSMCVAANGEQVPPQQRSVSTSNRNFVGRQGPGARTHLASPAMAAAAAIAGAICDIESLQA